MDVDSHPSNGHSALPPLSLSILGVEPIDEFIREIADFVHAKISQRPEYLRGTVEVEAKIGVIRDKAMGSRLMLPVISETVMNPDYHEIRFESNMSALQHKHFNQLLNGLKMNPPVHSKSPIEYEHQYLVDSFFDVDGTDRDKVRVTRDERTGEVLQCIQKKRLGNLDVHSPKRAADWRVSVMIEVPVAQPLGSPVYTRKKDRIAYKHEEFTIDLTQVQTGRPGGPPEKLHELEVEITRGDNLVALAARRDNPSVPEEERSGFDELIRAFVNNMRILVRNVPPNEAWQ